MQVAVAGNRGLVREDDSHIVCFIFKSFPVFKTFRNQRCGWWEEGEASGAAASRRQIPRGGKMGGKMNIISEKARSDVVKIFKLLSQIQDKFNK